MKDGRKKDRRKKWRRERKCTTHRERVSERSGSSSKGGHEIIEVVEAEREPDLKWVNITPDMGAGGSHHLASCNHKGNSGRIQQDVREEDEVV